VSSSLAGRWPAHVKRDQAAAESSQADTRVQHDDALDFVRFCYRRRRVTWPALYDEMVSVAARGAFRGLGFAELADQGISFCLPELHKLATLTDRVVGEEEALADARSAAGLPMMLTAQPATS